MVARRRMQLRGRKGPMGQSQWNKYAPKFSRQIVGVHKFQRVFWKENLQTESLTDGNMYFGYNFKLTDIAAYQEITNLFDFYRITGVKLTFIPLQNGADAVATHGMPVLSYVPDLNDATPVSNTTDLLQYPNVKLRRLTNPFSVYFRPRPMTAVGLTGTGRAESRDNQWVSTDTPAVEYFGLKGHINHSFPFRCQVYVKLYIEAKNPR